MKRKPAPDQKLLFNAPPTKKCTLCGKTKSISDFYISKVKDRVRSKCKKCEIHLHNNYRKQNPEKVAKLKKKFAEKHKEKIAAYQKKWREENREKMLAYGKEYYKLHPSSSRTPEEKARHNAKDRRKYNRELHLKKKYGLSEVKYSELLKSQNGRCAICGTNDPRGKRHNLFHIDHSHKRGLVRGLLCSRCNMGLGSFLDNTELLHEAIKYLIKCGECNEKT